MKSKLKSTIVLSKINAVWSSNVGNVGGGGVHWADLSYGGVGGAGGFVARQGAPGGESSLGGRQYWGGKVRLDLLLHWRAE